MRRVDILVITLLLALITSFCSVRSESLQREHSNKGVPVLAAGSLAGDSGAAAGKLFLGMLSDGVFSRNEQAKMHKVLANYYGMLILRSTKDKNGRTHAGNIISGSDVEDLVDAADRIKRENRFKVRSITFWRIPTPEIASISQSLTQQSLKKLYESLAAGRDRFPELAKFDKEHVILSREALVFQPSAPARHQKVSAPLSLAIYKPNFMPTAEAFPRSTYLPSQRLQVSKHVGAKDKALESFVNECIEESIRPLVEYEKTLSTSPLRQNW